MRDRLHLGGFWRDERGASAVEFALIAPLLFAMLLGVIQYGSLFLIQGRMTDTARDTARRLAVGEFDKEADAEAYAAAQLATMSPFFDVEATLPDFPDRDVTVTITVPKEKVAWLDLAPFGMEGFLTARFRMFKE